MHFLLTYHDVAYKTNTLAAWDMARLASLDTFTPSGNWGNKIRNEAHTAVIVTIVGFSCCLSKHRFNSFLSPPRLIFQSGKSYFAVIIFIVLSPSPTELLQRCVFVCVCCPAMSRQSILDAFPPLTQCSQSKLQIQSINEWIKKSQNRTVQKGNNKY